MDYEKLYKESLEKAKAFAAKYVGDGLLISSEGSVAKEFNEIFQELCESEDKTFKELIHNLITSNDYTPSSKEIFSIYGKTKEDCLAWLEKQREQNTIVNESPSKEMILAVWELGNIWKELTKGSSCTEYGTQLQYIQKHWNESGYYEKLQGEQKPTEWSEDDERILGKCIDAASGYYSPEDKQSMKDWLKSLKPNHWKPSEQNIKDLEWCADLVKDEMGVGFHRLQVFIDDLKNL